MTDGITVTTNNPYIVAYANVTSANVNPGRAT